MGGEPFCQCTHTALAPNGDIFVSDGYGNARVHKFSPDGRLIRSWGTSGVGQGEFNLPHNICCDEDGFVYVADRENHRVQIFDGNGKYQTEWRDLHRPSALFLPKGRCPYLLHRRVRPDLRLQPQRVESRPARLRRQPPGRQGRSPASATARRRISPARSPHRMASPPIREATSTWARSPRPAGAICFPGVSPDKPRAVLQKLVKVE